MSVQKQGKKNRKLGRAARKPKTLKYKTLRVREHNKLKRVLKSNGLKKAVEYALKHNLPIPTVVEE